MVSGEIQELKVEELPARCGSQKPLESSRPHEERILGGTFGEACPVPTQLEVIDKDQNYSMGKVRRAHV